MLTNLATLPLRVSLRLATRVARETYDVLGKVLGDSSGGSDGTPSRESQAPSAPASAPAPAMPASAERPRAPRPAPRAAAPAPAPAPEPEVAEEPHVSEEPVLVDVSADPGAEDGAGAQLRVAEPFPGYGKLSASDLIDHLQTADVAELGTIRLYEGMHRGRKQVLEAIDQRLKATSLT